MTRTTTPNANSRCSPAAVVLLSGGLDSATTLAVARDRGFACHALTFDYGQRHRVELEAARRVAEHAGVASHRTVVLDRSAFEGLSGSALTDDHIEVPKDRAPDETDADTPGEPTIPVTYVPARNTIFLSHALALAEVLEAADVFLGVNAVDYSGYPDCRPEFIQAYQRMANLATRAGVEAAPQPWLTIHTPLIDLPKTRIIKLGLSLNVDYALTHSCYDPQPDPRKPGPADRPCGRCDSCLIRLRAFEQIGRTDPAIR